MFVRVYVFEHEYVLYTYVVLLFLKLYFKMKAILVRCIYKLHYCKIRKEANVINIYRE